MAPCVKDTRDFEAQNQGSASSAQRNLSSGVPRLPAGRFRRRYLLKRPSHSLLPSLPSALPAEAAFLSPQVPVLVLPERSANTHARLAAALLALVASDCGWASARGCFPAARGEAEAVPGPPAGRGAGAAHRSPIRGARGPLETPAATRSSGARLSQPAGRRRPEARGGGRHGDPLGPGPVPGASGAALTVLLPARAGSQLCPRRRSATSVSPPSLGRAAAWARRRRRRRPVEWAVRARV